MSFQPVAPDGEDRAELLRYLAELGARPDELDAAERIGGLGALAVDLIMRPDGPTADTFEEFVAGSGLDAQLLRRLWVACGFPRDKRFPFPVTTDLAAGLRLLVAMAALVGEDAVVGFARVVGSSAAHLAESLTAAARVGVEVPQRAAGTPYSDVVRGYVPLLRDSLPQLLDAIAAVLRRHVVLVSYQSWSTDTERVAITLDRAVGFADLVGSTEAIQHLSVSQLATMVTRFEERVWDVVSAGGGRVVKLIGDEAMFVFTDPGTACTAASLLVEQAEPRVRAGLAFGPVVAMRGDYYGPTVNLAARLTASASPSTILVSGAIRDGAPRARFEPVEVGPLRGFEAPVPVFRLVQASATAP